MAKNVKTNNLFFKDIFTITYIDFNSNLYWHNR
jgi:hypothetical protein